MTLCPIAIVAGCQKCPALKVCPLKGVLGDYRKAEEKPEPPLPKKAGTKRRK
jgi:hypothetical protein